MIALWQLLTCIQSCLASENLESTSGHWIVCFLICHLSGARALLLNCHNHSFGVHPDPVPLKDWNQRCDFLLPPPTHFWTRCLYPSLWSLIFLVSIPDKNFQTCDWLVVVGDISCRWSFITRTALACVNRLRWPPSVTSFSICHASFLWNCVRFFSQQAWIISGLCMAQ